MNDKEFNKYLGIANHDIQVANNHEELKSYVASILFELDNLQSNWNSLRELLENEKKIIEEDEFFCNLSNKDYIEFILDKMNELESSDSKCN